MTETRKQTIKRWVWSTAITFIAGAALAIVPEIDSVTLADFQNGAIVGLVFAGVRAGFKAVVELFLLWYNSNRAG